MTKIYKYQKVRDAYTTYCLTEPDYNLLDTDTRITELCTIDGVTYVSVPDSIILPDQPEQINVEEVTLTDELKEEIKEASLHVQLINNRVVEKIRQKYSLNDEIKMLRISPSEESTAYDEYVESCREWGRTEKAKLGV
jgi:hypothetical protein